MATTSPASQPASSTAPAPAPPPPDDADWPAKATEAIVTQVERVRDKTTGPALKAARYAVFTAFAVSLGTVALIILVIMSVRILDNYLPDAVFGETHTWMAHTIIGTTLLVPGLLLFHFKVRRHRTD